MLVTIPRWAVCREYYLVVRELRIPPGEIPRRRPAAAPLRWTSLAEAEIPEVLAINPLLREAEIRRRWREGQECVLGWWGDALVYYRWYSAAPTYIPYLDKVLRLLDGDCLIEDAFTAPAFRARGIHAAAAAMTLHRLRGQGFQRAIGVVARYSRASIRVAIQAEYTVAGTVGYWSFGWWRRYFATGKVCLEGTAGLYVDR